ncbi:hypothetical protein WJX77_012657 [Trebouxia sp. C0004]
MFGMSETVCFGPSPLKRLMGKRLSDYGKKVTLQRKMSILDNIPLQSSWDLCETSASVVSSFSVISPSDPVANSQIVTHWRDAAPTEAQKQPFL